MKAKAILFGPFVGELCWEFYRFAPHAIYLKKRDPGVRIIVLTRESRFDLYGQYADILVPLRIKNDEQLKRNCFKLIGYEEEYYNTLVKYFKIKFRKRFNIIAHKYPDVRLWRYKVKWQFPRSQMDYDFKPREKNTDLFKNVWENHLGILDCKGTDARTDNDDIIDSIELMNRIKKDVVLGKSSVVGCTIECLRNCHYVIGNIKSELSQFALLMGIPLIHIGKRLNDDYLRLINPLDTPVICSNSIQEGIETYENNF